LQNYFPTSFRPDMPKCRVVPISMLEILDDEKNMNDNMENALVFTGNIILFCMI